MPNINLDNVQLLNTVRQYAPVDYQNRIPAVTQGNIESAMRGFQTYTPDWDTFFGVFLQKIGLQLIRKSEFRNPFAPFKMAPMRLGSKIEEVAINLQKAHAYKNNCYDVFNGDLPDTRVNWHSTNRHDYYSVQAPLEDVMRQAFISEYSLSQYLGALVDNLITSDQADEYILFKQLLAEYATNEGFYNVRVIDGYDTDMGEIVDPASLSRGIVRAARQMYRTVKFPSAKYSPEGRNAGLITVGGDMVLIMTAETEAMVDVESLAAAFHMDKADFLADNVVIIDEWPREFAGEGIWALLVDRDFFMVTDTLRTMQPAPINPCNLSQSFYYHVWEVISYSRFVPAIMISAAPTTNIDETPATVQSITITMDENARVGYMSGTGVDGSNPAVFSQPGSVRLIATGSGNVGSDAGFDLNSVEWSIYQSDTTGNRYSLAPSDTHIDRNGILTIGNVPLSPGIAGMNTLNIIVEAKSTIDASVFGNFYVSVYQDR